MNPHLSSAWTTGSRCHRSRTAQGADAWPRWSTAAAPPTPPATAQPPGAPLSLQCRPRGSALPSECSLRPLQKQETRIRSQRGGLLQLPARLRLHWCKPILLGSLLALTGWQMHSGSPHPCGCWSLPDPAADGDQPRHRHAPSNDMKDGTHKAGSMEPKKPATEHPRQL